jgi:V8-like Glu-specific endopeptidase
MADELGGWTPEELLAELRGRERARRAPDREAGHEGAPLAKGAAPPAAERDTAAPGVVPRFRKLGELSSAELARLMNARQRAIYGVDDRQDVKDVTNEAQLGLAEAGVALVEAQDLHQGTDGRWTLHTKSYQAEYNLCPQEKYASQPLGCFCSGVLVAPDVIATAGHCVKDTAHLSHIRFVFGFRMLDKTKARTTFDSADVYEGRELIDGKLTTAGTDWALVRLDRPVVGRTPVMLRTAGKVPDNEPVFVIGHPCGLPQKLAGGARVRNNAPAPNFVANLDTYGGNSGSPVFSAQTNVLEGLLVRGQKDFVSIGSCNVSMVFPTTGAGGEDVTRSTEWAGLVEARAAAPASRKAAATKGGKMMSGARRETLGAKKRAPVRGRRRR